MAFIFGAAAFIILAFILLLFPSRLSMKGKLLLIVLIMILSVVSYMANTFLPLWQTIGMIFLLAFLFTYLLSKRSNFLYTETENYEGSEEVNREEKKHILPVRIIGSTVFNPVIESTTVQNVVGIEKESASDGYILSEDVSDLEPLEAEPVDQNEEAPVETPRLIERAQQDLDMDLDVLLNRFTLEDELELIQPGEFDSEVVNRDLESLFEDIEDQEITVDHVETTYVEPFKDEDVNDHVIDEIELMPIKKPEEKKVEQPFTPFELIEEIKEFKKEK